MKIESEDYEARVLEILVAPKGENIFCEAGTTIRIEDEAAGEFISVSQDSEFNKPGEIRWDKEEWEVMKKSLNYMFNQLRK